MTERYESATLVLRAQNRSVRRGVAALWIVGALAAVPMVSSVMVGLIFALPFWCVAALGTYSLRVHNPYHRRLGRVSVDAGGVYREGVLVAPRSDVVRGLIARDGTSVVVMLERRTPRSRVELGVADEAEGRAVLRALGLDASQTAADFMVRSPAHAYPWAMMPLALLLPLLMRLDAFVPQVSTGAAFLAWLVVVVGVFAIPQRVRVGADGILASWLGRERYFPFGEIAHIRKYQNRVMDRYLGIELQLRSGKNVRLPIGGQSSAAEVEQLYSRMSHAVDAYGGGYADVDKSMLHRGGRASSQWLASLRALGTGAAADHRRAAVPVERLVRIATDPTAAPLERASAAIAAAPSLSDADGARIRRAADASASPKLRVALARAAEPSTDDDALVEALAALEAEQALKSKS